MYATAFSSLVKAYKTNQSSKNFLTTTNKSWRKWVLDFNKRKLDKGTFWATWQLVNSYLSENTGADRCTWMELKNIKEMLQLDLYFG